MIFDSISRSENERYKLIVDNSVTSARYFDFIIKLFIKHILRCENNDCGIFEKTEAYYNTIEQQAHLTLHIHLLL